MRKYASSDVGNLFGLPTMKACFYVGCPDDFLRLSEPFPHSVYSHVFLYIKIQTATFLLFFLPMQLAFSASVDSLECFLRVKRFFVNQIAVTSFGCEDTF